MSALAKSVPAVFENGTVRFQGPPPFSEGDVVTVSFRSAASRPAPVDASRHGEGGAMETDAEPVPPLDPDDPLVKLLRLTGDGPGDGSLHVDDYKLGRKRPTADGRGR